MFANTITLTATDTGQTLYDLLVAAGAELPIVPRVACVKIFAETAGSYLVPNPVAYTTTVGNVPDQYGYSFDDQGSFFEMAYPQNSISLNDIVIGGVSGNVLHAYGYAI